MADAVEGLLLCIEELRKFDPDMPIQRAAVFLTIALHEGCTVKQICEWLSLAQTSVSRNVRALGAIDRHGKPGGELVEVLPDPADPRRTIHRLSAKGRRVTASIRHYLE